MRTRYALWRCDKGIAVAEFAFMLPLLLMILLGGVEMARSIIIHQKIDRIALTMANLVAQSQTISLVELEQLLDGVAPLARPIDFAPDGVVVISSVVKHAGDSMRVSWQYRDAGSNVSVSRVGLEGQVAVMPPGFTIADNEVAIVAEVFYRFEPLMLTGVLEETEFYKVAVFKPRLGALDTLSED